jgi:hypothetical protein
VTGLSFEVFQPSPSYVVLVSLFLLDESVGQHVTAALMADYDVEVEAVGAGCNYIEPGERKTMAVNRVRSEIIHRCSSFVGRHVPGFFAGLGLEDDPFPTAEFLLLQNTPLSDSEERPRKGFLDSLRLGAASLDFVGISHPGLLLRLPEDPEGGERGLTFAASLHELLPGDSLENGYGGRTPQGFVHRLHGLSQLLGLWAVHTLITDLDAAMADIRDQMGIEVGKFDRGRLGRIEDLQRGVEMLVADSVFAMEEWRSKSGLAYLLEDAADFQPRDARETRGPALADSIGEAIQEDASRIMKAVAILRDALQIQSSLVASQASVRAAQTNQVLQILTIILAIVALTAAITLR